MLPKNDFFSQQTCALSCLLFYELGLVLFANCLLPNSLLNLTLIFWMSVVVRGHCTSEALLLFLPAPHWMNLASLYLIHFLVYLAHFPQCKFLLQDPFQIYLHQFMRTACQYIFCQWEGSLVMVLTPPHPDTTASDDSYEDCQDQLRHFLYIYFLTWQCEAHFWEGMGWSGGK